MAFAPTNPVNKPVGRFTIGTHMYEYANNPEMVLSPKADGGKNVVFPHLIFVWPYGAETRMALVLKTVVHVIIDETADGKWVVERWKISRHRSYNP